MWPFLLIVLFFEQADDVRALLGAAMPPASLPAFYKPQLIKVSQPTSTTAGVLSSVPSSPPTLSAASSLDNLATSFSESQSTASGGAEGTVALEKDEGNTLLVFFLNIV